MKMLGSFGLRFALLFALLAWPWPGLRQVCSVCFRAQARFLGGTALLKQSFRVEAFSAPRFPNLDTLVVVAGRENSGPDGRRPAPEILFDSRAQCWIPLAMLMSLAIATPLPWSKRLKALLVGAFVIQILVAATVLVGVAYSLTSAASPAGERPLLMYANRLLGENVWVTFVLPLLLWALWLAWGGHWQELGERLNGTNTRISSRCA